MPRVLLIDDDEQVGPPLATYFQRFELTLDQATRPSAGLARLREGGFDAAILDVMLPEMDGFELCRTIRRESDLPVVMLTARGEVTDRVVGLELGADDYLPKPFEPRELVARLQTVLRRQRPRVATPAAGEAAQAHEVLRFDGLTIDTARRSVERLGEPVALTGPGSTSCCCCSPATPGGCSAATTSSTACGGAGIGASHQTGWTGLIARLLDIFGRVSAQDALETPKEKLDARLVRQQVGGE